MDGILLQVAAPAVFRPAEKISQVRGRMRPGETIRIINEHDPRRLHYQFEAEGKGTHEWQYLEQGPKDWTITIKKIH
ncbi:MAG: DUF2249 domain-containing protein [Chloroflexi bacterium]|nr:DUF2249 domain-containing protein [Chloroflexota bacterium]